MPITEMLSRNARMDGKLMRKPLWHFVKPYPAIRCRGTLM